MVSRIQRPVPGDLQRALVDAGLLDAYRSQPRRRRHDAVTWIRRAHQPGARRERVAAVVDSLSAS